MIYFPLITLASIIVVFYYMVEKRSKKIPDIRDYFPDNFDDLDNDNQRYIINQLRQENTNYWIGYAAKIWVTIFWISVTIGICLLIAIITKLPVDVLY